MFIQSTLEFTLQYYPVVVSCTHLLPARLRLAYRDREQTRHPKRSWAVTHHQMLSLLALRGKSLSRCQL